MHYYQFNIGDYKSHTEHLSEMEDLAFRRLLDWYYLHERPIPLNTEETARLIRMRSHIECITTVLQEYFERTESGWINHRADIEISKAGDKSHKASESAKARWNKAKDANALPTLSESNATHNPLHITQDTLHNIKEGKPSLSETAFPSCPHQDIIKIYSKHLPHLPQPRIWDGTRASSLRQRWVQASKPSSFSASGYKTVSEGLAWWDDFFAYIANDTKLARGFETQGRVWTPDLPWIVNANNFAKIIDGKYSK